MAEQNPFLTFVDPNQLPDQSAEAVPGVSETPIEVAPIQTETTPLVSAAAPATEIAGIPTPPKPVTRTYYQDMSKVMGQNDPRTMSEVLTSARMEEKAEEAKTLVSPKNKIYLIVSVLLLLAGFAALGFALYRNYATSQALLQGQQLSLIRVETNTNVTLVAGEDFKNRDRIAQAFAITIPLQTMNNIFFTTQTIVGLQRLSFANTVGMTGGIIPEGLAAVLDGNFMYGTYQSSAQLPFLILRVNDYDDAFDGTRAWEPLMIDHLGFLFNLPDELLGNLNKSTFEDRVIANRTVRAMVYHAEQAPIFEEPALLPTALPETESQKMPANETTIETESKSGTATDSTEISGTTETTADIEGDTLQEQPLIIEGTVPETTEPKSIYQEGDIVLMYTFLNENTILITTSESVLREILFRLTNAQLLI